MEPQSSASDQLPMMKRGADGQKVPKSHRHNEDGQVLIRSLMNPAPGGAKIMNKEKSYKRSKARQKRRQTDNVSTLGG